MIYFVSIVAGLLFGSFANVCIFRMPQEASIRFPGSYCPSCKKPLRWVDNIPILSFIALRGRCYRCRNPISWQYPIVEASLSLMFLMAAWRYPNDRYRLLIMDLVSFYVLTISIIDAQHKIIPDELSLSLVGFGWLLSWINPFLFRHGFYASMESVLATIAGGMGMLIFAWAGEKIFKKEALGGGDIKLLAGFGALLGWRGLMGPLVIGSTLGALFGGGMLLLKRIKRSETIPFGPFLCIGAYLSCLYPSWINLFLSP
jgi:leader peptidase (prepilin peptidase)/N-methyltransferase